MFELKKLFHRDNAQHSQTEIDPNATTVEEIQAEYRACIDEVLARAGVASECVEVEIRHLGTPRDGRPAFSAMVRLVAWERHSGLRVLLGLPMLERGARRLIGASWVGDTSHFAGLWLHPSGQIIDRALLKELGADLGTLEGAPVSSVAPEQWSVHPELEGERRATDWGAL